MLPDALAPLRRLLPSPSLSGADPATQLHAAVTLMRHVRLGDRIVEAEALAGTPSDITQLTDTLRRELFWKIIAGITVHDNLTDLATDLAELRRLQAERMEMVAEAIRMLRQQPEVIGAYVPVTTATAESATAIGTARPRSGTPRSRTGTGRRHSGTRNRRSGTANGTKRTIRRKRS